MMRRTLRLAIALMMLLVVPLSVSAQPPSRPLDLTTAQFDRLCELESQPEHAAIVDVHATYKSERERSLELTRLSDDVFTVAYNGGFPVGLLWIIIAAAPL